MADIADGAYAGHGALPDDDGGRAREERGRPSRAAQPPHRQVQLRRAARRELHAVDQRAGDAGRRQGARQHVPVQDSPRVGAGRARHNRHQVMESEPLR